MAKSDLPPIRFGELAAALLAIGEPLLQRWLPGGVRSINEYKCASLRGGAGGSCSVNLVTGKWADFANGEERGGDFLSLYAAIHGLTMAKAALQVADEEGLEHVAGIVKGARQAPAPGPVQTPAPPPAAEPREREGRWKPVTPVPEFASPVDMSHYSYGEPQRWWRYEIRGRLYGYVLRFDRADPAGGLRKVVLPLTFCRDLQDPRGSMRWTNKQWEAPRPLYLPRGDLSADARLVPVVGGRG
jgi:putative DNA primase/helicase